MSLLSELVGQDVEHQLAENIDELQRLYSWENQEKSKKPASGNLTVRQCKTLCRKNNREANQMYLKSVKVNRDHRTGTWKSEVAFMEAYFPKYCNSENFINIADGFTKFEIDVQNNCYTLATKMGCQL